MADGGQNRITPSLWSETGAIANAPRIDDWISISTDGSVEVRSGKVELGTGVRTALMQIVAEELGVALTSVHMVMGDTGRTPDEGYTAGSKTIQFGGYGLRMAAAAARDALLEHAAARFHVPPDRLIVSDGRITVEEDPGKTVTYAELMAGKRFDREIREVRTRSASAYSIVGVSVPRQDLPGKFTGVATFVHDIRVPGMLHARVVRPPRPGARLLRTELPALPQVRVVAKKDFLAVVAEREEVAIAAAREIKAVWEGGGKMPADHDVVSQLLSLDERAEVSLDRGTVDEILDGSVHPIDAVYTQPYQSHASITPSCAVASMCDGELTVYSSTQGVYPLRGAIADLLGIPAESVRVVHVEGAGCFGQNGADDVAAEAALIAHEIDAPVRLQWSRADEFAREPYGPAMVTKMRGAIRDDGVVAWQHETWTPSHAYRPRVSADFLAGRLSTGAQTPPRSAFVGGDRNAATDYAFEHERVVMHWIEYPQLRVSSFRSLGAYANAFANESFMDELAAMAGADPVEFRLRYMDDGRGRTVLERAAAAAGWGRKLPAGEGLGIAYCRYENRTAYVATVAHVAVDPGNGGIRLLRFTVAHDCGLIINPDGVRNQIEGNIIQGASRALKEQVTWNEAEVTSIDWRTYPILRFTEIPPIDIILVDRPEEKAVGAGEPATITVAPAIANAVFSASGIRLRQVPFTLDQRIRIGSWASVV